METPHSGSDRTDSSTETLRASPLETLNRSISDRSATVAVVGLGYVGLPLLVAISAEGFPVIGVDSNDEKIAGLLDGESYVPDVTNKDLAVASRAVFVSRPAALAQADVILITVPTPLTDGVPDLSLVKRACADVAGILRPGQLVIFESTTYPGTTEEVVRPLLEESGLVAGRDFALAYSPERIDPGGSWGLKETPKIVSGIGALDTDLAALFYGQLVDQVITTPRPREAEMAKLIENTFRHVNIALVNELATVAPELGVDLWAALDAAATKPFGYMPFWPGPGVGGHCIAIDPNYLSWRVGQRLGFGIGFIERAKEVNNRMPGYVAARIGQALNDHGKPIWGSRVMAIGVPYKAGVNDVRESPAIDVLEHLICRGAVASYHDDYVPEVPVAGRVLRSEPLDADVLAAQDCVAILTAHPQIDYEFVVRHAHLVFDARGVTRHLRALNRVLL
jgi:UDP-N-acetyl-D-glucosamine dehydrogenase